MKIVGMIELSNVKDRIEVKVVEDKKLTLR